jgi:predicted Zn finger-like uncharacterized protein
MFGKVRQEKVDTQGNRRMSLLQCPTCQKKLNVTDENLGKKIRCAACKTVFQPSAGGAVQPSPDPPAPVEPDPGGGVQIKPYREEPLKPYRAEPRPKRRRRPKRGVDPEDDSDSSGGELEDAKAVRARPRAPGPLHLASWGLFIGALFGLLEGLVCAVGFAVYTFRDQKPPGCFEMAFTVVSLAVGVGLLIGSFHFHPRRRYVVAMMSAIAGMVYGVVNVLPAICCGILSTLLVAEDSEKTAGLGIFFAVISLLSIPATLFPLIGGVYGIRQLMKPEFKRLYLD